MLIFFDTEFEGLRKNANLISIGMISENNKVLYLEFKDIDVENQDSWVSDNVLFNTCLYGTTTVSDIVDDEDYHIVDNLSAKYIIQKWLSQFDNIQFVSDVSHYDFVFLIDLFGDVWNLPDNVSPYCHDINQDIARNLHISDKDAFDCSRETILLDNNIYIEGKKHNSLYDAKVIKAIYELYNK